MTEQETEKREEERSDSAGYREEREREVTEQDTEKREEERENASSNKKNWKRKEEKTEKNK